MKNNILTLKVKKSPLFIRAFMFFLSFAFFSIPILSLIITILLRDQFHIGFVVGIIVFGLLGFYLLRISLWNTFGIETITFNDSEVIYEADYNWFKDGKKIYKIDLPYFSIRQIGYKEDYIGTLIISDGDESELIESVVKISINKLEELIEILDSRFR